MDNLVPTEISNDIYSLLKVLYLGFTALDINLEGEEEDMYFRVNDCSIYQSPAQISTRCPHCLKMGVFENPVSGATDINFEGGVIAGKRRCPDPACRGLLFFVWKANKILASYPPERIDFDSTNIPADITEAFKEAITCHSNECYMGAAMLVRKTLELLCLARGAKGSNLKDKLKDLRTQMIISNDLMDAADDLRLLGNDAAHVMSINYYQVSRQESEVAIEVAKEILKAVYQYDSLLKKIRSLKKP